MFLCVEIFVLLLEVSISIAQGLLFDEPKIVNGQNASIDEFTFMVSLQYSGKHFCGGSIISPRFVLSAAHCFNLDNKESHVKGTTVVYGSVNLNSANKTVVRVTNITCHPEYYMRSGMTINDVAILKLSKAIPPAYEPVTLAGHYHYHSNKNTLGIAVGWGINATESRKPVSILQKVDMIVYRTSICNRVAFERLKYSYHICAGWLDSVRGVCKGDSGGPLLIRNVMVGITSFGVSKCETSSKEYPHVFTRVSSYVEWVKEYVQDVTTSDCSSRHLTKRNISVTILLQLTLLYKLDPLIFY